MTLIVTVKYVFIVLCADDEGEGGTFAIYSLLSRYVSWLSSGFSSRKRGKLLRLKKGRTNRGLDEHIAQGSQDESYSQVTALYDK